MNFARSTRLSVAPMLDWTDRHCRYFHRLMSAHTLLYTEMVTAPALVRGGALHLLEHDPSEQPLAAQLGGSDPDELGAATKMCVQAGFHEVNLNIGCPSDRVQAGAFGAVLMKDTGLVANCLEVMRESAQDAEITVKCRIGVDDQDPEQTLPAFLEKVQETGVSRVIIHARKAWLQGLSPKQNRDVPPLDYPLVHAMKQQFPKLHLSLNGGVTSLDEAQAHLDAGMDGVMIGRVAYHNPADILLAADQKIFAETAPAKTAHQIVDEILPYIERHLAGGGRLHEVTRHMMGLFAGRPGARAWRRTLSESGTKPGAGTDLLQEALSQVPQ